MKNYTKYLKNYAASLLLIVPLLVFSTACSDDDDDPITPSVDESALLVAELEGAAGDYMNTHCPAIVKADQVNADLTGPKKFYIMDIRGAADYANGHVPTAVNVAAGDVLTHVAGINAASYDKLVVVCYSGQTAAWVTAILRMSGYTNAFSMKYGMSSWHSDFDVISPKVGSQYVSQFVTSTSPAKNTVGSLPAINTGKGTGAEILADRVNVVLAEGFGAAKIDAATVFSNPDKYYVINYWGEGDYLGIGHIPASIQYTPKVDFKSTGALKTLPADKTVVVYCYTGQTSANVAAILRVLGYDAKSLLYGTNGMIWQTMKDKQKTHFDAANDCMDFAYEK